MNLKVITVTAIGALSLGGIAFAQGQDADAGPRHGGRGGRHHSIEQIVAKLNLTPDQKTKIQPIVDQAQPKIAAIHQEAMQKSKAVIDEAMGQIRPMLTADQQKQLDDLRTRHGGRDGRPDAGDSSY